jgi:hypothetical protein
MSDNDINIDNVEILLNNYLELKPVISLFDKIMIDNHKFCVINKIVDLNDKEVSRAKTRRAGNHEITIGFT